MRKSAAGLGGGVIVAGIGQWLEARFGLEQAGLAGIIVGALILLVSTRPWAWPTRNWLRAALRAGSWVVGLRLRTPLYRPGKKTSGTQLFPPSVSVQEPPPPEDLVPIESMEQLRMVYAPAKRTFRSFFEWANEVLNQSGAKGRTEDLTGTVLRKYVIPRFKTKMLKTEEKMQTARRPAPTVGEFDDLKNIIYKTTCRFFESYTWVRLLGESALGDEAPFRGERYASLYEPYSDYRTELKRVADRNDLGELMKNMDFENFDPITPPIPDTSESPPQ